MHSKWNSTIKKYDVISFDIFDTAILRLFFKPYDIFNVIENYLSIENFAKIRYQSSQKARSQKNGSSCEEITLNEIYNEFKIINNLKNINKIIEVEKEIEILCSVRNSEIYNLYSAAVNLGKTIIFTSDIYIDKETIEKILHNAGYIKYNHIFISSEVGKTKASGGLYAHILQKLSITADKILHIGDNDISDIQNSNKYNIKAIKYTPAQKRLTPQPQLDRWYKAIAAIHNQSNIASMLLGALYTMTINSNATKAEENKWYWIGAQLTSPILLTFCLWLEDECRNKKIKHLFFQARDGLLIKKTFDQIQTSNIKTTYMLSSRCLWQKALQKDPADTMLKYLYHINFFEKNSAIVDVGRHGTLQRMIQNFITTHKIKHDVIGYYIDIRVDQTNSPSKMKGFFTNPPHDIQPFLNMLDFLLMADHPLITGIECCERGFSPTFLKNDTTHTNLQNIAREMHRGVNACISILEPILKRLKIRTERNFANYLAHIFSTIENDEYKKLSSIQFKSGIHDETQENPVELFQLKPAINIEETDNAVTTKRQEEHTAINEYSAFLKLLTEALKGKWNLFSYADQFEAIVFIGDNKNSTYKHISASLKTKPFYYIPSDSSSLANSLEAVSKYYLRGTASNKVLFILFDKNSLNISRYIHKLGFDYIFDLFFISSYPEHFSLDNIKNSLPNILAASKIFDDDISRTTFFGTLAYRITCNPLYIRTSNYQEYFHPLCLPEKKDCIFDAGAYDGDTLKKFLNYVGGNCVIISFEPDHKNFKKLQNCINKISNFNGKAINIGLWDADKTVNFVANGEVNASIEGVRLHAPGNTTIRVMSIDSFCTKYFLKPSFIKLDIEGAEQGAIRGGKTTLGKIKPKLAVCVYHNYDDLWEIPILIKKYNNNYRLSLGHHSALFPHWDTVLYAY